MSTTSSTSTQQSPSNEKIPESDTSRIRRAYKKSYNSPTLEAFFSFDESLGQFLSHVMTKIYRVGTDDMYESAAQLLRLNRQCESMQKDFKDFISELDDTITDYEKEKPTNLAVYAYSVISIKGQVPKRSTLFKDKKTIDEISTDLIYSIGNIFTRIQMKRDESIYNEQYSMSLEKKLKKLKKMCEAKSEWLEEIGNQIKAAMKKNDELKPTWDQLQIEALQQKQEPYQMGSIATADHRKLHLNHFKRK